MRPAELLLKELATIVDIGEVSMVQQDMYFDEVESLCNSLLRRLGEDEGRWVLVRLAQRLRARSPDLSRRVLNHAAVRRKWRT